MKIVDIREMVVPIKSPIRNAFIDFSQMTVSVLALITDVIRDGKPVETTSVEMLVHLDDDSMRCPSAHR